MTNLLPEISVVPNSLTLLLKQSLHPCLHLIGTLVPVIWAVWFVISWLPASIPASSLHPNRLSHLITLPGDHRFTPLNRWKTSEFPQRWRQTHTYISTGDCDSLPYVYVLLKLFIAQRQVWLNRYNSVCRLSRKSCKLILRAFSGTLAPGVLGRK